MDRDNKHISSFFKVGGRLIREMLTSKIKKNTLTKIKKIKKIKKINKQQATPKNHENPDPLGGGDVKHMYNFNFTVLFFLDGPERVGEPTPR